MCLTLAGIAPLSSARVKLQAFSKKTTLVLDSRSQPQGPQADNKLFEDSIGSLVLASEDGDDGVRLALASALPALPSTPSHQSKSAAMSLDVAFHVGDYLLDLMHDENDRVRQAAASGLVHLVESSKYILHNLRCTVVLLYCCTVVLLYID